MGQAPHNMFRSLARRFRHTIRRSLRLALDNDALSRQQRVRGVDTLHALGTRKKPYFSCAPKDPHLCERTRLFDQAGENL